ncbi:MAG TPA: DUF3460 family protein [Burkholderiaceae bacterium]|jgi:hypothetical protein|nr:DUF3460 family protein [Burkholderiaceae bacterium]
MAAYESEITQFLKQLKQERPHLETEQRKGRAIWWDKDAIDLEQARRWRDAKVPQKPYPYQTET